MVIIIISEICFKIGFCGNLTKAIFFSNSYAPQYADKVHRTVENDLSLCSVDLRSNCSWYKACKLKPHSKAVLKKACSCYYTVKELHVNIVPQAQEKFSS